MGNNFLLEQTCINVLNEFKNKISENNIGLWCFKYIIAKRCLKTWHFIPINAKAINKTNEEDIYDLEIPEGIGSIGYMLLRKKGTRIKDTFADPRATVSQTDDLIGQKSALCYPIIDDNKRIILGLDFFSPKAEFFKNNHLKTLESIINDYKETFISLYNYSLEHDIFDLYDREIIIPNRNNLESFEDFKRRSYKEFLIVFHNIASNVVRIPLVELQKKIDENNFHLEAELFDPNEIINILKQELLLCNYKSKWSNQCPIIKGKFNSNTCKCCQQPLEVLIKYFDINKNSKPKPILYENSFYKLLIFPKKESIDIDKLKKRIGKILDAYKKGLDRSSPETLKINQDKLYNELRNIEKNFEGSFDELKIVLIFLVFERTYRWEGDIRTIDEIADISKNPIYLNPSTIFSLISSLKNSSVLKEYPPNIKSHPKVKSIEIEKKQKLQHKIKINGKVAYIRWEEKKFYKDLFYTYINDKWVKEIIINKMPNNSIKEKVIKYLNLKTINVDLDQFTTLNIYSPYPKELEIIREKFERYITNLYSFYETSILKEKTIISSVKSAIASIMSRNMSHNIGSHVLANYSQKDYRGKTINKFNINKIFNSYIQQRMDFIAGLTSGWYGVPEEIWFFKDLFYGFLQNIPLLDLIVESHGFNRSNIIFKIRLNGDDYELKIGTLDSGNFIINNSSQDKNDFLVGIPRGIIGNHAFYIILENIIRNSAKYGLNRPQNTLEVTISCKLNQKEGVYDLEIYDNLSLAVKDRRNIAKEIQKKIKKEIIDPQTGTTNYENMGIAEMKETARMLIGPDKEKYNFLNNSNQALRVGIAEISGKKYLKYMFHLMIPHLMTIISSKEYKPPLSEGIFYKKNPDMFLSSADNSFLFIISKDNIINSEIKSWYYPYRWLDFYENDIPEKPDWKKLFLKKYYTWIKEFLLKEKNTEYNLVISFERETEANRWKNIVLKNIDNLNIHIVLTRKENNSFDFSRLVNSSTYKTKNKFLEDISEKKLSNFILYDNHENFRGFLEQECKIEPLFSHYLGRGHEKLFGLLDYPPTDPFLLKYVLLNLWETAITKILIIDERIAESYLEAICETVEFINVNKVIDNEKFLKITTIFYVEINDQKYFVSERVRLAYQRNIDNNEQSQLSGLKLKGGNWEIIKKSGAEKSNKKYEICVMHQGVIDECIVPYIKNKNWFDGYKNICSHFVVTSGRGKFIKHIPKDLAFIEFSVIKANFVDDKSKVHLLKALSMTKGGKKGD